MGTHSCVCSTNRPENILPHVVPARATQWGVRPGGDGLRMVQDPHRRSREPLGATCPSALTAAWSVRLPVPTPRRRPAELREAQALHRIAILCPLSLDAPARVPAPATQESLSQQDGLSGQHQAGPRENRLKGPVPLGQLCQSL